MPVEIEARFCDPLAALLAPRAERGLRIGLVVPQSGPLGMIGPSAVDAALLAVHEVNVAGGVRGAYVDLVLVDGGARPDVVGREVSALCEADAVDALVGFHTSDVHRAVERTVAGRTPYVFTPPHEGGSRLDGVVCIGADPTQQLSAAVGWLTGQHGLRRWALVGNDYIWPRSVHASARRLVASHGSEVVLEELVALGDVTARVDRLVDELRRTRADAVLLSLVGRDLVTLHRALRHSDLDRRLVRLSGALEENGLLAGDGERAGTFYSAMSSFASMTDERHLMLAERHAAVLGPRAPVLDSYAEGVYDGLHLVARLAQAGALRPAGLAAAAAGAVDVRRTRSVHLARAEGLDLTVVDGVA